MDATGSSSVEPMRLHRDEISADTRSFFDFAPVLATHEGPWLYSRRPRRGAAFKVCGWVVGALLSLAILLDQLRADTLLDDGNKIVVGIALTFLAVLVLVGSGESLRHGRVRLLPSRRRLHVSTETYQGSMAGAAAVWATLKASDEERISWRDLIRQTQAPCPGPKLGDLIVTTYDAPREDYAIATMHLLTTDDEFLIWPPTSISGETISRLVQRDN